MARRAATWTLAAIVAALCAVGPARGEDPAPPSFADLKAKYEEARKAKAWEDVADLLPKLAEAAKRGKVEDEEKDAVSIFNRHLVHGATGLQVVALDAFGILARPTTSQYLRSFVDGDKAGKRPVEVRKAALSAWARIHDPGTHEIVLEPLVAFSLDEEARGMALHAATQYRHFKGVAKKHRFLVIRDFMQIYQRIYDQTTLYISSSAQSWWGLLNAPLLATFNELTGTEQTSFEGCVAWWREHRGKVQADRD
jgi:hypothetical protein